MKKIDNSLKRREEKSEKQKEKQRPLLRTKSVPKKKLKRIKKSGKERRLREPLLAAVVSPDGLKGAAGEEPAPAPVVLR